MCIRKFNLRSGQATGCSLDRQSRKVTEPAATNQHPGHQSCRRRYRTSIGIWSCCSQWNDAPTHPNRPKQLLRSWDRNKGLGGDHGLGPYDKQSSYMVGWLGDQSERCKRTVVGPTPHDASKHASTAHAQRQHLPTSPRTGVSYWCWWTDPSMSTACSSPISEYKPWANSFIDCSKTPLIMGGGIQMNNIACILYC